MDSIRVKRGLKQELPSSLPIGELAFCTDTRELYVGMGDSLPLKKVVDQEVINEQHNLNSKLNTKATINDTKNLQTQINNLVLGSVGDGNNAELVQARGEYDTLNDRLDEMDTTTLSNVSTNLISTSRFKGVSKNGSTYEQLDDLTYKVTCNESWGGTFNHRIKASYGRTYMFICKVKATDENSVGKRCWSTAYQYSSEGTNLGGVNSHVHEYYKENVSCTLDYNLMYYVITPNKGNIARLDLGISGPQGCSFTITEPIILDITSLTLDEIIGIDFPNYPYWRKSIDNFSSSNFSLHSITSEKCEFADKAEFSDRSNISSFAEDGDFIKLPKIYKNLLNITPDIMWGNGASYVVNGEEITVTPNASWGGEFLLRYYPNGSASNNIYGKKYKFVCAIKSLEDNAKVGLSSFMYSGDFTSLLGSSAKLWSEPINSDYKVYNVDVEINREGTNTLAIGIKTYNTQPYPSFTLTGFMLIDITDLTEEELSELNKQVQLEKYWSSYPTIVHYATNSQVANMALDLDDNVKQGIIDNATKIAQDEATMYTNDKISKVFSMPFVEETDKLTWTTKTYSAGTSLGWWVENKSKNLLPNSTYLYIVKWEGKNRPSFERCNELRNGAWYNATTFTNQHMSNDNMKVMSWIFTTDGTVTSPSLCCVVSNPTLDIDTTITVELYRIVDENYISTTLAKDMAKAYLGGNVINDYDFSTKIKWSDQYIEEEEEDNLVSKWKGKNALVIGDSITAAGQWQLKLKEELGMNVTTHAKGGIGIIAMVDGDKGLQGDYDNETNASGTIYPLNADKVKDKDLIVVLPAYNERSREYGQIGDLYPSQSTIIGMMQYQINRIYEELTNANNLNCKVLIATPHCAGKYNYVDADGYEQYPANSGRTMQTLSNTIKEICNYNNIPVCDLWHNSGINKFTWTIYGANPNPVDERYTKYQLNENGEVVGTSPMRYVKGNSYYQIRDGQVVLEEYTGASPYPFNGDQLHCSSLGYARIGECIVGSIIKAYGY